MSIFHKKRKKEELNKKSESPFKKMIISSESELDDITYIRDIMYCKFGAWMQYDVLLEARGYGWENMIFWASYMSESDLDISQGTLTVAPIAGSNMETELIEKYRAVGSIQKISELKVEQGVLTLGGLSKVLKAPVKIVWFNQTNRFRVFTLVDNEEMIQRYIETVIRRTFGTSDEMKLAKPIPEGQ